MNLVFPHGDLRINFFDQIKNDRNDDENGRPAQSKGSVAGDKLHNERQNCHETQKDRTQKRNATQNF